jgi:hypothetical protein
LGFLFFGGKKVSIKFLSRHQNQKFLFYEMTFFFPKEIIEMLMLAVDDPPTYGAFARCSTFTGSVARKHLRIRQRKLKGILPPLMLRANLDTLKQRSKIEHVSANGLTGIHMLVDGYQVGADPIQDHPGGVIHRCGDVVEIHADEEMTVSIGGQDYTLTPGRWAIPMICLAFHEVRTKSACKIQFIFLDCDDRSVLCQTQPLFQHLGNNTSLVYMSGMAGERPPHQCSLLDGFNHKKTMRKNGVCEITVSSVRHEIVNSIHSDMDTCPGIVECTEPVVWSWLVYGEADLMQFTITTRDPDAVQDWLLDKSKDVKGTFQVTQHKLKKEITSQEEISAQAKKYADERFHNLKKLVDIGLLEPFE